MLVSLYAAASSTTGDSDVFFTCHWILHARTNAHTYTHLHTSTRLVPSGGSIGGTQCSWRPFTPDTSSKQPPSFPHSNLVRDQLCGTEGITRCCVEWSLSGLQVLSSHYVCSITCLQPPRASVCTTIPPAGRLHFHSPHVWKVHFTYSDCCVNTADAHTHSPCHSFSN